MKHSLVVVPHIRGFFAVEDPGEGKEKGQISIVVGGLQHRLPIRVVESPYPVDGNQSLRGIQFHHGPDDLSNAISPRSGRKCVLEWHARLFELLGALLSHGACHSSAEGVASENSLDPAILLDECFESSQTQSSDFFAWTSATNKCLAAFVTSNVAFSSPNNTIKCSLVSPATPPAEPLGPARRLHAYFSLSN